MNYCNLQTEFGHPFTTFYNWSDTMLPIFSKYNVPCWESMNKFPLKQIESGLKNEQPSFLLDTTFCC